MCVRSQPENALREDPHRKVKTFPLREDMQLRRPCARAASFCYRLSIVSVMASSTASPAPVLVLPRGLTSVDRTRAGGIQPRKVACGQSPWLPPAQRASSRESSEICKVQLGRRAYRLWWQGSCGCAFAVTSQTSVSPFIFVTLEVIGALRTHYTEIFGAQMPALCKAGRACLALLPGLCRASL